jgi:hypothetical protein
LFRLFRFHTETESFNVSVQLKQPEDQPNSLIESIFWYFWGNLGLFWFVSKQFCLFRLFRYRFKHKNKPNFLFLVSQNKPRQNRNSSCFGLFWFEPYFFFGFEDTLGRGVCREDMWIPIYNYSYRKFIYVSILKPRG